MWRRIESGDKQKQEQELLFSFSSLLHDDDDASLNFYSHMEDGKSFPLIIHQSMKENEKFLARIMAYQLFMILLFAYLFRLLLLLLSLSLHPQENVYMQNNHKDTQNEIRVREPHWGGE